jgi:hypothetical protein
MRKCNLTKIPAMNIPLMIMVLLVFGFASNAYGQATSITSMGYRATQGGGGAITAEYTTGNLGNTWAEGEWVPYQLVISNVQNDYPNLTGFPDIVMSYDFTKSGVRFVDLVRDIQFGHTMLTDAQGWPQDDGSAYPVTTRPEIELAQNDIGNAPPLENVWSGFTLLNLPETQINRDAAGAIGTETDAERTFRITKADLIAAGVDTTANTIVIYYQLHESRSFIWFNTLQEYYSDDVTPGTETDGWGGYLYANPPFSTDSRNGSGYVPGSSGHIEVEFASGSKTVPIPIPEQLPGLVSGLKWLDQDGDGMQGVGEPSLSGWRIYVSGELEGIPFSTSMLTDGLGNYSFPNLTSGVTWTIKEDEQREVPFEEGYMQTYPLEGSIYELGTGILITPPEAGIADVGWDVSLTFDNPDQENLNFGNKLCEVTITCPPDTVLDCTEPTDTSSTGAATAEGNCPPITITYSDVETPGDCPEEKTITRTWVATDDIGNADTCVQIIQVVDDTPPIITCPPDTTFECDAVGDFGTPTAVDSCDPDPEITLDDRDSIPGDCANEYQLVLTYVATDYCGNADTCEQTITVEDNTPPVITCPPDTTFECDAVGGFGTATATDNCDLDPEVVLDDRDSIPGNCANEYQLVLTYIATDDCGNADTCEQTITVEDNTPPVITCPPDTTFECDAVGGFGTATATDNCDLDPEVVLDDRDSIPGDCPQEYQLVLTYVATDDCGNADTCEQTITVEDNTPPVITCPPDTVFECNAVGNPGTATAVDNCDLDVQPTFEDDTLTTECPLEIVRTWIAVDDCGNADTCQQNIMIIDETAPVLTCPADTTFECDAVGEFGVATATDNCDPDPNVVLDDRDSIPGDCANEYQLVLTYVATDICGNADTCEQTITVEDNTPPVIDCPDSLVFDCDDIGDFGEAEATDNCDPDPEVVLADRDSIPGDCPLEYELVLTWTATDECGNVDSCLQIVMVQDTIAPTITCADQDTIECEEDLVFMTPTAEDNCDPDPMINIVSTDTTSGPGEGEFTYTQCWVAVDTCGNVSDTCCQTIIRLACPQDFCTYTMGGWGSGCPDSQADDWMSTQPGCMRDHYFDSVFTDGVVVGDMGGFYIKFTTAYAVEQFLPAGETPGVLTATAINPTSTSAGVLAGQILALRLNREFSCAGVFYDIGLLEGIACYGSYIIEDTCGVFAGMTVDEFLTLADQVVGGNVGLLEPYGATLSDLNYTATCLNELFDNCGFDDEIIPTVYGAALKAVPEQFSLEQNRPNPFNPITEISFALPKASNVKLEIFNIRGQKVANLVDGQLDAGYHTVIWDGTGVASGIYFYRITTDEFKASKKMLLLK